MSSRCPCAAGRAVSPRPAVPRAGGRCSAARRGRSIPVYFYLSALVRRTVVRHFAVCTWGGGGGLQVTPIPPSPRPFSCGLRPVAGRGVAATEPGRALPAHSWPDRSAPLPGPEAGGTRLRLMTSIARSARARPARAAPVCTVHRLFGDLRAWWGGEGEDNHCRSVQPVR